MPDTGLPEARILEGQFNKPPTDVIEFFKQKGLRGSPRHWDWSDTMRHAHDRAFVVAKVAKRDVLKGIRDSLTQAMEKGQSFRSWEKALTPTLKNRGWWGKQESVHPRTGEVKIEQLGSPRRLQTIYETNMATAYAAGQYARDMEMAEELPYWGYRALHGGNRRQDHQVLDGIIRRYDDPFWASHNPPQGYGCKCYREAMDARDVERRTGKPIKDITVTSNPADFHVRTFPVQGKEVRVVGYRPPGSDITVYPHPGFDYSPGDLSWRTKQLLVDSIEATPAGAVKQHLSEALQEALRQDLPLYLDVLESTAITRQETLAVGILDDDTVQALSGKRYVMGKGKAAQDLQLSTRQLLATDTKLEHAIRDSKKAKGLDMPKEELAKLPDLLLTYEKRWDRQEGGLLFFSPPFQDPKSHSQSPQWRWKVVFNPWETPQGTQLRFASATKVNAQAMGLGEKLEATRTGGRQTPP